MWLERVVSYLNRVERLVTITKFPFTVLSSHQKPRLKQTHHDSVSLMVAIKIKGRLIEPPK